MILVFIPIKKVHLVKNGPPLDSAPDSSFTESTEKANFIFRFITKTFSFSSKTMKLGLIKQG